MLLIGVIIALALVIFAISEAGEII